MNTIKQNDLLVGEKSENEMVTYFSKFFGKLDFTNKYDNFDFYNDEFFIELKTRNIKHNQYSTLFFSEKKYYKGLELIDGCYFWELKKDNHETEGFIALGGRSDRGKNEIYNLFNVKCEFIKPLEEFI
jgi:hypothetical protein